MFKATKLSNYLSIGLLIVVSAWTYSVQAEIVALSAHMMGNQEVPAKEGPGMGTMEGSLNTETNELKWVVTYSDLSGDVSAAHIHGPAPAGKNAGVAVPFKGSLVSPITGQANITADQAADLLAGNWYVNLHTKANPSGEIRGQVQKSK